MFIPVPMNFSDVLRFASFPCCAFINIRSCKQPRSPYYIAGKAPSIYNPAIKFDDRPPHLLLTLHTTVHRMVGIRVLEAIYLGRGYFNVVLRILVITHRRILKPGLHVLDRHTRYAWRLDLL